MTAPSQRRFVLLRHAAGGAAHFDFMIEDGPTLATWQFAASPAQLAPGAALAGRRLAPHRPAYLDYEGPVSGQRGTVARLAAGTCRMDAQAATEWAFELTGPALHGRFRLHGLAGSGWQLTRIA